MDRYTPVDDPVASLEDCTCMPREACETTDDRPALDGLDERSLSVLWELSRLGDAEVAFSGIRRRLQIHQESLSRTLRRLEDRGLVEGAGEGYRLTDDGFDRIRACRRAADRPTLSPVVSTVVPSTVDPDVFLDRLTGRWFDGLHWYGRAQGPGEVRLAWLTDPDREIVQLRVVGGTAVVEAEPDLDDAATASAMASLLGALAEVLEPSAS